MVEKEGERDGGKKGRGERESGCVWVCAMPLGHWHNFNVFLDTMWVKCINIIKWIEMHKDYWSVLYFEKNTLASLVESYR